MKSVFHFTSALILATSLAGPVFAQVAAEPTENVTVFAPYVVKKDTTSSGIRTVSMSREVSFHDLDLTKDGDVTALEQRVNQAAKDICQELDRHYPGVGSLRLAQDRDCAKNASAGALAEARMVVAAVRGK